MKRSRNRSEAESVVNSDTVSRRRSLKGSVVLKILASIFLIVAVLAATLDAYCIFRFSEKDWFSLSRSELKEEFCNNVAANMMAELLVSARERDYKADVWKKYANTNVDYSVFYTTSTQMKPQSAEIYYVVECVGLDSWGAWCDAFYDPFTGDFAFLRMYDSSGMVYSDMYQEDFGVDPESFLCYMYEENPNSFLTYCTREVCSSVYIDGAILDPYSSYVDYYLQNPILITSVDAAEDDFADSVSVVSENGKLYTVTKELVFDGGLGDEVYDAVIVGSYDYGTRYSLSNIWESVQYKATSVPYSPATADLADKYVINYRVDPDMNMTLTSDPCVKAAKFADILYFGIHGSSIIEIVSIFLIIITSVYLCTAAGHHGKYQSDVRLSLLDRIPLLIYLGIDAGALFLLYKLIKVIGNLNLDMTTKFTLIGFLASFGIAVFILLMMSLSVRIKTHTLLDYVRAFAYLASRYKFLNLALITGWILVSVFEVYLGFFSRPYGIIKAKPFLIVFIAVKCLEFILFLVLLSQTHKITSGMQRVATGDYSSPINTTGMFPTYKQLAENINNASVGISNAVDDKLRSERLKTELITNVSHDIKTPLTSIINYVDLISKEDVDNENVKQYTSILTKQSVRLKKLIEDLIEASKASTGNIEMNVVDCNADMMVTQAVGEFAERIEKAGLELIISKQNESNICYADPRYLWRVFDNLLINICKYSLPGTRVYIDITSDDADSNLLVSFKNISKQPLNISGADLTERFVRGDSSRNTEGSGLGLSIAESLLTLMGGELVLTVDGDLFKATCKLRRAVLTELSENKMKEIEASDAAEE